MLQACQVLKPTENPLYGSSFPVGSSEVLRSMRPEFSSQRALSTRAKDFENEVKSNYARYAASFAPAKKEHALNS